VAGTLVGEELCQDVNQIQAETPAPDPDRAWIAKERTAHPAVHLRLGGDPHLTRHRLHRFLTGASTPDPELLTLAATVDHWWPEINAFVTPASPTRTEGYNRPVNRSNVSAADSGIETTRPADYDSTGTRKQRAATRLHADCPVKIEELHRWIEA